MEKQDIDRFIKELMAAGLSREESFVVLHIIEQNCKRNGMVGSPNSIFTKKEVNRKTTRKGKIKNE